MNRVVVVLQSWLDEAHGQMEELRIRCQYLIHFQYLNRFFQRTFIRMLTNVHYRRGKRGGGGGGGRQRGQLPPRKLTISSKICDRALTVIQM